MRGLGIAVVALGALWAAAPRAAVEAPAGAQMINLGCVDALAAVGHADLAGVFSFIPEKDGPAAFADFMVRNRKALKKFLAKAEKDLKEVKGVSIWDRQALQFAVSIYGSPLGETLEKPAPKFVARMVELAAAPALSLAEMTARRRK